MVAKQKIVHFSIMFVLSVERQKCTNYLKKLFIFLSFCFLFEAILRKQN